MPSSRTARGNFVYVTGPSGLGAISATHSGWGLKFFDYDNDGWKDLFIAQGHVMDNVDTTFPGLHYLESPVMIRNNRGKFQDVSAQSGEPFRSRARRARRRLRRPRQRRPDRDRDKCSQWSGHDSEKSAGFANHWVIVHTVGTTSNRDGIGAKIRVVSESGLEQYGFVNHRRELSCRPATSGFISAWARTKC